MRVSRRCVVVVSIAILAVSFGGSLGKGSYVVDPLSELEKNKAKLQVSLRELNDAHAALLGIPLKQEVSDQAMELLRSARFNGFQLAQQVKAKPELQDVEAVELLGAINDARAKIDEELGKHPRPKLPSLSEVLSWFRRR